MHACHIRLFLNTKNVLLQYLFRRRFIGEMKRFKVIKITTVFMIVNFTGTNNQI